MNEPAVVIKIFDKPNGGVATISDPSVEQMMKAESDGRFKPSYAAAMYMLTMLLASERGAMARKMKALHMPGRNEVKKFGKA